MNSSKLCAVWGTVSVLAFKFHRGTTFRMALVHAAFFSAAVFILFSIVYWSTVRSIREQLENEVRDELQQLTGEQSVEGVQGIAETITRRVDGDRSGAYLLLQDAHGGRIAGNMPGMEARDGWIELLAPLDQATANEHQEHVIRAMGHVFEDGSFLLVGRDTYSFGQLREIIVRGFLVCGVATIAVALSYGMLMSTRASRRLRAISATISAIMQGDLSRRLGAGGRGDEFDELTRHINVMLDRIQCLVDDLQQVSSDIAHDLRTPLTRLRHRLELALTASSLCATGCSCAGEITKAVAEVDVLLKTFSAMLRIAQIDSGSRRAHFRTVDLSHLLASLADTYDPVADDAGRTLEAHISPKISVSGDAELLTQMFVNLIENAVKHTPEMSTITVSLLQASSGVVAIVADNGLGISPDMREHACKRFVRLESSRTTAGSGLGLSLVAAIAQLHDIRLELDDNLPGLRVSLRFPPSTRHQTALAMSRAA
jgi:signal transduction histidine kinase